MFCTPKGQRVIQTWSHFNRNHSSFLGKRRISVEFFPFFKITKYPFPEDLCWLLACFSFHLTQIFWSSGGNIYSVTESALLSPKDKWGAFLRNGHRRGKENDHNPKKKFLKIKIPLPEPCGWETAPSLSHCLRGLFANRKVFLREQGRQPCKVVALCPSPGQKILLSSWVAGWGGIWKLYLDLMTKGSWVEPTRLLQSCQRECFPPDSLNWTWLRPN